MSRFGEMPAEVLPWSKRRHRQHGMAVVSVLLIIAVIALLASALMTRQSTAIRSAQAEQTRAQAYWLLNGEVSRVQALLRAEAQRTPLTRPDGAWAPPITGAVIGEIAGEPARIFTQISDEQSKFNMRNLIDAGQVDPHETAVFLRLCAIVGVPDNQALRMIRRVAVSLVESGRRAEPMSPDEVEFARAAARQVGLSTLGSRELAPRLRDLDDLLAVPGIDADSIARLRPYVTILPEQTWINANTAGPEVLAAGVPGLTMDSARAMLRSRDSGQWFANRGDVWRRLKMPEIPESEIRIGITSQWFKMSEAIKTTQSVFILQALLHDDKNSLPAVIWTREGA